MKSESDQKPSHDVDRLWFMRAGQKAPGLAAPHDAAQVSAGSAQTVAVLPSIQRERERLARQERIAAHQALVERAEVFDLANGIRPTRWLRGLS